MTFTILRRNGFSFWILLGLLLLHSPVSHSQEQNQPVEDAAEQGADTIRKEIESFFAEYESATQSDAPDLLLTLVDFDALTRMAVEQAQVEIPDYVRDLLVKQLVQTTRQDFETVGDVWQRYHVLQVSVFADGKRVEANVRSWSEDGQSSRNIFLLERGQRWRIVDWMHVDLGIQNSMVISSVIRELSDTQLSRESLKTLQLWNKIFNAARQEDVDTADELLSLITGRTLPNSLEGLRWIVTASIFQSSFYDPLATIEALDKAEAFQSDAVFVDYLRMQVDYELGEYERVIYHAQRYLTRFGPDDLTDLFKGMAHRKLGQTEEAIAAFESGLQDNPESIDLNLEYLRALPTDQKSKFADRFRRNPWAMESFETLADEFESEGEYVELKALLDAAAATGEESPNRAYYAAIVLLGQSEAAKAMDDLIAAQSMLAPEDDYFDYYQHAICRAAVESSQVMRAYEICEDKVGCFGYLLQGLGQRVVNEQTDAETRASAESMISDLVAKHLADHDSDSETYHELGNYANNIKNNEKAKTYYEAALKHYAGDDIPRSILYNLVSCHVELNSIVDLYRTTDFKRQVFEIASYRLASDSDTYHEMERLHEADFPNIPQFVAARMLAMYTAGKFQEAIETGDAVEEDGDLVDHLLRQIKLIQILSLTRLGRNDEAILSARRLDEPDQDRARALVYAIRQDRLRFREAVKRLVKSGDYWKKKDYTSWVAIPDTWFEGLGVTGGDSDSAQAQSFDAYRQVRRLVFLIKDPIAFDLVSVREAIVEAGLMVSEIHRDQLLTQQDNYLCPLSPKAFLVCADGYKFFIMHENGKYLNQIPQSGIEHDESDEALQARMTEHTSWLSIDIFAWPQTDGQELPAAIPDDAVRSMIRIADTLLGGQATVAIHSDASLAVVCDGDLFARLRSAPTFESFQARQSEVAE